MTRFVTLLAIATTSAGCDCGAAQGSDIHRDSGHGRDGEIADAFADRGDTATCASIDHDSRVLLTAGTAFTCAAEAGGRPVCWGANEGGELGVGLSTTPVSHPTLPDADLAVTDLDSGPYATCAVSRAVAHCWGRQFQFVRPRLAPIAIPTAPRAIEAAGPVTRVAVGLDHACAISMDGRTLCWGGNYSGQLGNGVACDDGKDRMCFAPSAVVVVGVPPASDIAAGSLHTCIIGTDLTVWCWGADGSRPDGWTPPMRMLSSPTRAIEAYGHRTCASLHAGPVVCWGGNELAVGDPPSDYAPPEPVPGVWCVGSIGVGSEHSCALTADGGVSCWGANALGQRGLGHFRALGTLPTSLPGLEGTVALAVGDSHSCIRSSTRETWCWGWNRSGQLGDGVPVLRLTATEIMTDSVTQLIAGAAHACTLMRDATVACWGDNEVGQLGDGMIVPSRGTPQVIVGLPPIARLGAGINTTCATDVSGATYCWGRNDRLQAGMEPAEVVSAPAFVGGLGEAIAVGGGVSHTCVLRTGGDVACFGGNEYGQLGHGATGPDALPGEVVSGVTGVTNMFVGAYANWATLGDGRVWAWGGDFGLLFSGESARPLPALVPELEGAAGVAAGADFACAWENPEGFVRCWGSNVHGQLGLGDFDARGTPTTVPGVRALNVAAGFSHVCGVTSDRTVACWGSNLLGELGDGSLVDSATPVGVTDVADVISVVTGGFFSCALTSRGSVWCWGTDQSGQLGTGRITASARPARVVE